jgi:hypothetical protein
LEQILSSFQLRSCLSGFSFPCLTYAHYNRDASHVHGPTGSSLLSAHCRRGSERRHCPDTGTSDTVPYRYLFCIERWVCSRQEAIGSFHHGLHPYHEFFMSKISSFAHWLCTIHPLAQRNHLPTLPQFFHAPPVCPNHSGNQHHYYHT